MNYPAKVRAVRSATRPAQGAGPSQDALGAQHRKRRGLASPSQAAVRARRQRLAQKARWFLLNRMVGSNLSAPPSYGKATCAFGREHACGDHACGEAGQTSLPRPLKAASTPNPPRPTRPLPTIATRAGTAADITRSCPVPTTLAFHVSKTSSCTARAQRAERAELCCAVLCCAVHSVDAQEMHSRTGGINELASAVEARGSRVNRRAGMRLGPAADLGLGVERGAYALEVAQLLLDGDLVRETVLVLTQLPHARARPAEGRGPRAKVCGAPGPSAAGCRAAVSGLHGAAWGCMGLQAGSPEAA